MHMPMSAHTGAIHATCVVTSLLLGFRTSPASSCVTRPRATGRVTQLAYFRVSAPNVNLLSQVFAPKGRVSPGFVRRAPDPRKRRAARHGMMGRAARRAACAANQNTAPPPRELA